MKAHVSVDLDSGLVHSLSGIADNVSDINETQSHINLNVSPDIQFG